MRAVRALSAGCRPTDHPVEQSDSGFFCSLVLFLLRNANPQSAQRQNHQQDDCGCLTEEEKKVSASVSQSISRGDVTGSVSVALAVHAERARSRLRSGPDVGLPPQAPPHRQHPAPVFSGLVTVLLGYSYHY